MATKAKMSMLVRPGSQAKMHVPPAKEQLVSDELAVKATEAEVSDVEDQVHSLDSHFDQLV